MNKQLSLFGLAIAVILLLCLLPMPYGYYTLVRFMTMFYFGCLAVVLYNRNKTLSVVSIAIAILFQPFVKIPLGREMWNVVDIIVAIGLIVLQWKNRKKL